MNRTETPDEVRDRERQELQGRNIAHYQVILTAWIQTRMEHDKTMATVSSAGIGLLVTLGAVQGVRTTLEAIVYSMGLLAFLLCIWTLVRIFRLNSDALEKELRRSNSTSVSLKKKDRLAFAFFLIGVVCFCVIGISTVYHKLTDYKGVAMSKPGAKNLTDSTPMLKKSLDGIHNVRPESVTPSSPPPQQPTPSQPGNSSAQTQGANDDQSGAKKP